MIRDHLFFRSKVFGMGGLVDKRARYIVGVMIGIAGAFRLTRFLASFLFDVKARDPLAFLVTPLLLSLVALLAVWIPARRAVRVDPISALRFE
jgi:putative ABC transport system permease protein